MEVNYNEMMGNYYNLLLSSLGKVLELSFEECFVNDIDNYWEALYNNALEQHDKGRTSFFFQNANKLIANSKYDEKMPENYQFIYLASKKVDALRRIRSFDKAEYMKQLEFIPYVQDSFKNYYNITSPNFKYNLFSCRNIRNNAESHSGVQDKETYWNIKELDRFINSAKKLLGYCNTSPKVSDNLKKAYNNFLKLSKDCQEKAGYPPIDIISFSKKNDIDEKIVIKCCEKYNYAVIDNCIYEVNEEKVLNSLNEMNTIDVHGETVEKLKSIEAELISANTKLKLEKEQSLADKNLLKQIKELVNRTAPIITSIPKEEAISAINDAIINTTNQSSQKNLIVEKVKNINLLPEFQHLNTYQKGFLNNEQYHELMTKYNFFVDTSALLNKTSREYITNILIPYRVKYVKKSVPLFLHRSTRNELYELANMNFDEMNEENYDEVAIQEQIELKNTAKKALLVIGELRNRNLIYILGKPSYDTPSCERLLNLIYENSNKRFCIITQDPMVAEYFSKTRIKTLCAIKVAANKPLVWSCTINNLHENHNQYLDEHYNSIIEDYSPQVFDSKQNDKSTVDYEQKDAEINAEEKINDIEKENQQIIEVDKKNTELEANSFQITDTTEFSENIKLLKQGDFVYDENGNKMLLTKFIAKGGEGSIYDTENKSTVAKIYHLKNRSLMNYKKLLMMVNNSPNCSNIIWPTDIVYDSDGNYVGFLMAKTPAYCKQIGESVLKINFTTIREKLLLNWDRRDLLKICLQITSIFNILHSKDILMGDVNPSNILINPNNSNEVYFVDCDSYQIGDFLCPVGTPVFTAPSYYKRCNMKPIYSKDKRTIEDEEYAMTTLLFQILMNGQTPFAAKTNEKKNIIEDICNYKFSFKTKESSGTDVPDGPYRMIWNNMEFSCKEKFADVFEGRKLYSAMEWNKAFYYYLKKIENNEINSDLFPKKYIDLNGSFVDFVCAFCHEEANMHKNRYNKLIKTNNNPILLCNTCRSLMSNVLPDRVKCSKCKSVFHPTVGEKWHHDSFNAKYYCNNCKKQK